MGSFYGSAKEVNEHFHFIDNRLPSYDIIRFFQDAGYVTAWANDYCTNSVENVKYERKVIYYSIILFNKLFSYLFRIRGWKRSKIF